MRRGEVTKLLGARVPRPGRRSLALLGVLALSVGVACSCATKSGEESDDPTREAPPVAQSAQEDLQAVLPLGPVAKVSMREHPAERAWVFDGAEPVQVEIGQAEARGYTVVDLGPDWRPYIFSDKTPGGDDLQVNDYAARYLDLANDRSDSDGDPLAAHEHNYLELYGIPPTLEVALREWREVDAVESCLRESGHDASPFTAGEGGIGYRAKRGKKRVDTLRWSRAALAKAMKKAHLPAGDLAAAATHPKTRALVAKIEPLAWEVAVIENAQKRLRCERVFGDHGGAGRFDPGDFDAATHHALADFERKHDIMGWGHFTRENLALLAKPPRDSAYERLRRVITSRVVSAAGIVEDGSAAEWKPDFRWKDRQGREHALRDLAGEFTEAAMVALGMGTPDQALAALERLEDLDGQDGFGSLLVAVRLPELPEYYAADMEFDTVIDRGDVWYDFPYGEDGREQSQPRQRYPKLTLYVTYEGQHIPLVHWRTTIGSWRSEEVDGQEWFKYKNSDVGERVWKDIMAAPVWIPPASTPTRSLVKRKYKDGKLRTVVNYDETGPGYKSAYGLVAAYHIKQVERRNGSIAELDNQIRTHGSVDYMSILRRYSHGCHRLYNMNAVRLFSFILLHREYTRLGQTNLGFRRNFEANGVEHRLALATRGYRYELTRPIPVVVTEGRIRGTRRSPYTEYLPKPGVIYDAADDTGGDESSAAELP